MKKIKTNVEWTMTVDEEFFGMHLVCPVDDKDFNSPRRFHFHTKDAAEQFLRLVRIAHIAIPE